MKVYVLLGIREAEMYQDPGAEEPLSVWATKEAAEEAGKKLEAAGDPAHRRISLGYDHWDVAEFEVWT